MSSGMDLALLRQLVGGVVATLPDHYTHRGLGEACERPARAGRTDPAAARPARDDLPRPRPIRRAVGDDQAGQHGVRRHRDRLPDRRARADRRLRPHRAPGGRADAAAVHLPGADHVGVAARLALQGVVSFAVLFLLIMYMQGRAVFPPSTPRCCSSAAMCSGRWPCRTRGDWRTGAGRCCPPPRGWPSRWPAWPSTLSSR